MASVIIPKVGKYVGMVMYAICVILLFLMFGASFIGLRPGYTDLYKAANDLANETADNAATSSAP